MCERVVVARRLEGHTSGELAGQLAKLAPLEAPAGCPVGHLAGLECTRVDWAGERRADGKLGWQAVSEITRAALSLLAACASDSH